jgi:dipeptidyl aminopeptidase/acylaminoacyl peptidase
LQDELQVNAEMSFNHFFVQPLQPGGQPQEVTHGFYRFFNADFTPDGKHMIITADIDSTEHPDRSLESEIYIADSNGNHLKLLLGAKDKVYSAAVLSPSGKWLAFQYGPTSFVSIPVLAIMPLDGGPGDIVSIPFDRNKGNCTWSNDEKFLYFTAQSNGGAPIYRLSTDTKKIEQLSDFNSGIVSFDLQGNQLVFAKTEVQDPFELYASDAVMQNPKRISHFNDEWLQNKQLSFPEKHVFRNNKGMDIEFWVMKPTNFIAGKTYPLLLDIHGGPSAMWGPGETSMWHEFQFFCSRGYGVVYCNPRGSGGYGLEFLRANINDWGAGPTSDVLTALDKAVAEGWADTSKLLVTGGSYAGYLVAWIIGHDQRFKAACSQRGVYDFATFFGEGNAWRLVPNYFGGYPWDPKVKAELQKESPITYVQNINTPYIIFHGENDRRTGFVEGEMLYRSLKVLGRPVEYVRHPGATHEITRSGDNRQRIDQMLRTYEFFERMLNKK